MLPERTLGWQTAKWCTGYLLDIDDPYPSIGSG
jgi:hypothetical protein